MRAGGLMGASASHTFAMHEPNSEPNQNGRAGNFV